ncbi:uncharacterized protein isoform X1 [Salmo salar]|uniref:Uncharacterized protein isoform X1 n=1 Tax=Salmo salar TaxID=8030 RepID=A0ABM3DK22_SALSA|nr:uncharacterized protein LOC106580408 isoform X1 [Salmo salar]
MARGGTECDSPVVHGERECHTMQKLKFAQKTSTLPIKSHALPTCTDDDDGPIVWGFSEERPINKIGKSIKQSQKWYNNAELKQSLMETGVENGVEEKASIANGESSGGNVEELKGDIAENELEEKSDASVVQVEYVDDKACVEYREGDGLATGGVEEVIEIAAEVEYEDGMRAEMKGGKGTDRYESGEAVVAVMSEIEEKDAEGKRILEKEDKVAPKRKNIRKRRRSAKLQRDKEANSSASFVETVLSWLLTVFLWWQAFSSRKFPLSIWIVFLIFMSRMPCGVEGLFIDTSNDHWNVSCIACKSPGCAVNKIWCGEDELLKGLQIPPCTSIPQKPKTACHHDGRAYVLMDKEVECNMEYLANYVSSEKTECPPLLEAIQGIYSNNTLSPPPLNGSSSVGVIVTSVLCSVGVIVIVVYLIRHKHQGASRNQDEETEMSALNNGTNQNGGPANRDNNEEVAVNMLEGP